MRSSDETRQRALYLVTSDISARFLRGQLAHLIGSGIDVAVGTRRSDPPAVFDDGVEVHDLPFVRDPSPIADARGLIAVARLVRRMRPTVVNASTPKAGLLGMLAAWLLRVPQRVYVVRGLRFETATGPGRRVLRWLERLTTSCATDVVYNSRSLLAVAEEEGAVRRGRGIVLAGGSGNGIEAARFEELPSRAAARRALGLADDAKVIGFVGRLTRDKGIVDLVDALPPGDDATLLLVGEFEDGDPVPAATRRDIETAESIVHVGWVDDTRTVYPAIDVLAFPSYREGLPNVPLEAQLCRVPVVAYAATGTVDAVHDGVGGVLVPVGRADELGRAVDRLLADPERRAELGSRGQRWVGERFDQQRIWDAVRDLYR